VFCLLDLIGLQVAPHELKSVGAHRPSDPLNRTLGGCAEFLGSIVRHNSHRFKWPPYPCCTIFVKRSSYLKMLAEMWNPSDEQTLVNTSIAFVNLALLGPNFVNCNIFSKLGFVVPFNYMRWPCKV
jgi:hypothetical protein